MPKIKGILIPAGGFDYYEVEVERDNILDYCYEHLNCRCIDIVTGSFDKDGQFATFLYIEATRGQTVHIKGDNELTAKLSGRDKGDTVDDVLVVVAENQMEQVRLTKRCIVVG